MFKELELNEHKALSQSSVRLRILCAVSLAALTIGLIAALASSEKKTAGLQTLVEAQLARSGVENPVTAVLLNFRSYDTLLEIAVLLVVAVAMLPNAHPTHNRQLVTTKPDAPIDPVLAGLLRWLVPSTIVMAGYMLWTGAYAPGGAFHAGALIAGAGVLAALSGRYEFAFTSVNAKLLLALGLCVFIAVGVASAMPTGTFLRYPETAAGSLILLIESAATVSIAAILLLLYQSLAPGDADSNAAQRTS